MGAQTNRNSGGTPPPEREANKPTMQRSEDESPEYVVARRRSVRVDGKTLGPGQAVVLPDPEIKHLLQTGFVVPVEVEPSVGIGVSVGGLQIKGGRRPGGAIA